MPPGSSMGDVPVVEDPIFGKSAPFHPERHKTMKPNIRINPIQSAATLIAGSFLLVSAASAATTVLDSFNTSIFRIRDWGIRGSPQPGGRGHLGKIGNRRSGITNAWRLGAFA